MHTEPRALQGGVGAVQSQVCPGSEITGHVVPQAKKGLVDAKEMGHRGRGGEGGEEKEGGGVGWGAQLHWIGHY